MPSEGIIYTRVAIVFALALILLIGNYLASKNNDIDEDD